MRVNDVELSIPVGGYPRLVEITFLEDGGARNRTVLEKQALEKLVSEGQKVLDYWNSPPSLPGLSEEIGESL